MNPILYRLRAEIRRQWLPWLGIALLIGLVAGPVLGLISGARRTSTVYDRFLAESEPADVLIAESPDFGITNIDLDAAAGLPGVAQAAASPVYFGVVRLEDDRLLLPGNDALLMVDPASVGDGLNRPRAIRGRLADPTDPTEVVVGFHLAGRFGLDVGDTLEIALIEIESLPATQLEFLVSLEHRIATPEPELFDWEGSLTGPRVDVEIVGVTAAPLEFPPLGAIIPIVRMTPAFAEDVADGTWGTRYLHAQLEPGVSVAEFQQRVEAVASGGSAVVVYSVGALQADSVEQRFDVQSLGLAVLGAIFGLAGAIIVVQASARLVASNADAARTLAAIGMRGRSLAVLAGARMLMIAAVGAVIAVTVGLALSPLWPAGDARHAEMDPGVAFDAVTLGVGAVLIVLVVPLFAAWQARADRRRPPSRKHQGPRLSAVGPPWIRLGTSFALSSRAGGGSIPVRSSRLATVTALTLVAFVLVLQDQSARLEASPASYGWSWEMQLGSAGLPNYSEFVTEALAGVDEVAGTAAGTIANLEVDGLRVDALAVDDVTGSVLPTLRAGTTPSGPGEIALGALTLDAIDRDVGDTVTVTVGDHSEEFLVVGEVVTPTLGDQGRLGWGGFVRVTALTELVPGLASNVVLVDVVPGTESGVLDNIRKAVAPIGTTRCSKRRRAQLHQRRADQRPRARRARDRARRDGERAGHVGPPPSRRARGGALARTHAASGPAGGLRRGDDDHRRRPAHRGPTRCCTGPNRLGGVRRPPGNQRAVRHRLGSARRPGCRRGRAHLDGRGHPGVGRRSSPSGLRVAGPPVSSSRRAERDAVVVGSGPNGLVAAVTLAAAGWSVLVVESADRPGGGTRSAELMQPGVVHDVCSAIHPLGIASPALRDLPLDDHGLRWVHPEIPLAHPLDRSRTVLLHRSIDDTATHLGDDARAYRRLMAPLARSGLDLTDGVLAPLSVPPAHPVALARFGAVGITSANRLARRRFDDDAAQGLFAGLAAHSILSLRSPVTAGYGLMLGVLGHLVGWPMAKGGSQAIADALVSLLESLGGSVECGREVTALAELPPARAVLLDVSPRQVVGIAGDRLPARYRRSLERFRHGPGVCKVDWVLDGPIPWADPDVARSATVHLGGTLAEIVAAEDEVQRGGHPERPFVLLAQQSLFDDTRAPAGVHTGWGYTHVPNGSTVDMTERIEAQVERFAPGFRDCIVDRHTMLPAAMEAHDDQLHRRRHQRRRSRPPSVRGPAPRGASSLADSGRRALPVFGIDPSGWRGARHVRSPCRPRGAARRRLTDAPAPPSGSGRRTTAADFAPDLGEQGGGEVLLVHVPCHAAGERVGGK